MTQRTSRSTPMGRPRIAPHLFVFTTVFLLVSLACLVALPKVTGTKVFASDLEDGGTYSFDAAAGKPLRFFLIHSFPGITGVGVNATLTVRDASGDVAHVINASVPGVQGEKDQGHDLFATIPDWIPPGAGAYTATYTFVNGTASDAELVIRQGGFIVKEGGEQVLFFILAPAALLGFGATFAVKPRDPEATGRARYLHLKGASSASLLAAVAAGLVAAVFLLLYMGG